MLYFLEQSTIATVVGSSTPLTAALSALHAIGYTIVMGGAILSGLRLTGACFGDRPLPEIVRPAGLAVAGGLLLSVTTGFLLFAPRAVSIAGNSTFQLKMTLLVAAACMQLAVVRLALRVRGQTIALRVAGPVALILWLALAVTACAFILLE